MDNGSVPADVQPPADDSPAWSVTGQEAFDASERNVLLSLGAAVVARWYDLPRDIQKQLFNAAASGQANPAETRSHIARFLHESAHPAGAKAGADLSI
ncbi:hypothetical protein [Asticcacaulis solisilvae]|uniref:hypothetical protein n=1 Tax=Asticcacaulis solisilvae TaxID=1217274 RepID=UPI003FD7B7FC